MVLFMWQETGFPPVWTLQLTAHIHACTYTGVQMTNTQRQPVKYGGLGFFTFQSVRYVESYKQLSLSERSWAKPEAGIDPTVSFSLPTQTLIPKKSPRKVSSCDCLVQQLLLYLCQMFTTEEYFFHAIRYFLNNFKVLRFFQANMKEHEHKFRLIVPFYSKSHLNVLYKINRSNSHTDICNLPGSDSLMPLSNRLGFLELSLSLSCYRLRLLDDRLTIPPSTTFFFCYSPTALFQIINLLTLCFHSVFFSLWKLNLVWSFDWATAANS